jgi:Txe/YoeB family toxin of toxin-antitoxin system
MYELIYSTQARKDAKVVGKSRYKDKIEQLFEIIRNNPFQNTPPYEKLYADLSGAYSRRINGQHRLVYQIYEERKEIKIISMWTHYE